MASPPGTGQLPADERPPSRCQADETLQEQQEVDRSRCVALPDQRGGYDCEFVERPRELQKDCPICLVVLREPLQVTCCGYSFCRTCIERILINKKACPTCNETSFSAFPNKGLQRALYSFHVRCVYEKRACEWTGELRELDGHLNLNPDPSKQLVGCDFAAVVCSHCCEYFQRCDLHAHESESCPQRPFSCDYCKDYNSVYEDVVDNHWLVCKCYPVPCPNKCRESPERQNVETHVNTVCPLTVVNCDFCYAGCEVQLARKDMLTHLAERQLLHLSLLALHNQQLTQLAIQQKGSLEELKEHLEVCQHKIQELEREKLLQGTLNTELRKHSEARKCEIEELRKENQELKQKMYMNGLQQDESLANLQSYIGMLPPVEITFNAFEKMKTSNEWWFSPPFYTHPQGYKMCLCVVANGHGKGKGTHVSVFARLIRGEFDDHLKWPFRGSVVIQLCNQLENKKHCVHTFNFSNTTDFKANSRVTNREMAEGGYGTQIFIAHNQLNPASICQYLKHDCLHFRIITVESLSVPGMLPTERTMMNFEQSKIENDDWYSSPFYTHPQRYKMRLNVHANGLSRGKGTHVSVFAYLMRGEFDGQLKWPFQGSVVIQLCNELEDRDHCGHRINFSNTTDSEAVSRVTRGQMAQFGYGVVTFITHTTLTFNSATNCQYLKHDCLHFRIITVESLSEHGVLPAERTMTNFEQHKLDSDHWYSPPFYTHTQGYKMCLRW